MYNASFHIPGPNTSRQNVLENFVITFLKNGISPQAKSNDIIY